MLQHLRVRERVPPAGFRAAALITQNAASLKTVAVCPVSAKYLRDARRHRCALEAVPLNIITKQTHRHSSRLILNVAHRELRYGLGNVRIQISCFSSLHIQFTDVNKSPLWYGT